MPALVLAVLLQIADVQSGRIEHASADDCAIMALAGKERLGWGTEKPKYSFFIHKYYPDGRTYVADCSWKDFGIVPPEISGSPKPMTIPPELTRLAPLYSTTLSGWHSDITRPKYDPSGILAEATVVLSESGFGPTHSWACNFFKYGGQWRLSGCQALPDVSPGLR